MFTYGSCKWEPKKLPRYVSKLVRDFVDLKLEDRKWEKEAQIWEEMAQKWEEMALSETKKRKMAERKIGGKIRKRKYNLRSWKNM